MLQCVDLTVNKKSVGVRQGAGVGGGEEGGTVHLLGQSTLRRCKTTHSQSCILKYLHHGSGRVSALDAVHIQIGLFIDFA